MVFSVSRMLKLAEARMDNAATGVFPSMKPLAEPLKWTARQREASACAAVASGAFVPLFDDLATSRIPLQVEDLMSAEI